MRRTVGGIVAMLLAVASPAAAQEDTEDRGSRAARAEQHADVDLGYHAAAFAGMYAQDPRFGPLADLGVEAGVKSGDHRLTIALDYLYEPFSTKSFNFADEDQTLDPTAVKERLAQRMHEVSLTPRWKVKLSPRLRVRTYLDLSARFPEFESDRRYALLAKSTARWGKLRGAFGELEGRFFAKKYPEYLVADRRIDQRGFGVSPGGGWVFEDRSEIALHYEVELTDYIDARYDMMENGAVVRATKSKDYLTHDVALDAEWRATSWLRLDAGYTFRVNDSINYDREMTGRNAAGALEARFIPDYYDYRRHKLEARARLSLLKERLDVDVLAEYWFRDFKTYVARDVDNVWTGDLRHDNSVEAGLEAAYRVARFDAIRSTLHVTGFASHLHRDSNMKREVSFATNYDISRVFVGLEMRSR